VAAGWISFHPAELAHATNPVELAPPTFSGIYERILLPAGCGASFCHGADSPAGALPFGSQERAYEALVNVPATGLACAGSKLVRVVPGDPTSSLLLMKLSTQPPCGLAMPAPDAPLKRSEIETIRRWVELGALDN